MYSGNNPDTPPGLELLVFLDLENLGAKVFKNERKVGFAHTMSDDEAYVPPGNKKPGAADDNDDSSCKEADNDEEWAELSHAGIAAKMKEGAFYIKEDSAPRTPAHAL